MTEDDLIKKGWRALCAYGELPACWDSSDYNAHRVFFIGDDGFLYIMNGTEGSGGSVDAVNTITGDMYGDDLDFHNATMYIEPDNTMTEQAYITFMTARTNRIRRNIREGEYING